MSRIGKKPISIPQAVEVEVHGQKIKVKGPKGELERNVLPQIKVEIKEGKVLTSPMKADKGSSAFWGLTRTLIFNMLNGVSEGYKKSLQMEGVGYRARVEARDLVLELGFSHPVKISAPEDIEFSVEKNIIVVSGIDKEKVGQWAAKIKAVRPVEPYKGKGVRYVGEVVRKKEGKRAAGAAT